MACDAVEVLAACLLVVDAHESTAGDSPRVISRHWAYRGCIKATIGKFEGGVIRQ
jgi:hypothetical protein